MTTTPHTLNRRTAHRRRRRVRRTLALAGTLLLLAAAVIGAASVPAYAGTYVIYNCPSTPAPNGDPGDWTVFGAPQNTRGTCTEGSGGFVGPLGGSMGAATIDGVQIGVPGGSGITIKEAKIWWSVPHQVSGADTFAMAAVNTGAMVESGTPYDHAGTPDDFVLPSDTTELTLADYCSNDDASQPCVIGGGENPDLQLFGSQLTLSDNNLPSGSVTGGALVGSGPFSGTQSLNYDVQDNDTGVRYVQLRVDGQQVAQNDYLAKCSYTVFQPCPASESDTISWNTATVPDGQHNLEVVVGNAAQNTAIVHDATITTHNAPANTALPTILTTSQLIAGTVLTAAAGSWSVPSGAGTLAPYAYQWEDCDSGGENCHAIPGAQNQSYMLAPADAGHTLRVAVSTSDDDGQTTATSTPTSTVVGTQESAGNPGTASGNTSPNPALTGSGAGIAPGASVGVAGFSATSSGAPNGTPASETARLLLSVNAKLSRSYAHRAFRLTGRLLGAEGHPIGTAVLDVIQQPIGATTSTTIAEIRTHADGTFALNVPAGPSRTITIAYRAFSADTGYAAQATVTELVSAGVRLQITPRHTSPGGTILLTGYVGGPVPRQGVIVELLVHYRGRWEPFRTPRTNATGRFQVAYQFQGALGRFPFRAEVPASQADFSFTRGISEVIDVATQ